VLLAAYPFACLGLGAIRGVYREKRSRLHTGRSGQGCLQGEKRHTRNCARHYRQGKVVKTHEKASEVFQIEHKYLYK
jgi:hypothetical protein